jgi:pyruvate/2-oxoglutarate dehydrogenase complex dihydrolipoamide dehydrogenase (E3) component
VTYVKGWGSLTANPGEVTVTKDDGTTETLNTKSVILATGSEPSSLPVGPARYCSPRHPTDFEPSSLSQSAPYDVASSIR